MDIKRDRLEWEKPIDGYDYTIDSGKDRPGGRAQLIYKTPVQTLPEVRYFLFDRGLRPEDKIAHLNEFYPNGPRPEAFEHMRQGVGGEVLEHLEAEALSEGAKAMYVYSQNLEMRGFLRKNGFEGNLG